MKFLIVVVAILGVSMAGAPDNRGKRGLVSSLGYGYDASLSSLHLPLASSVVSGSVISAPTVIKSVHTAPIVSSHVPITTSVLSAPSISTLSSPTIIKTVQTAPIVKTIVSQPHEQILSYAPSLGLSSSLDLHSLGYASSVPSIYSDGLIKSYNLGGLPITSQLNDIHAW